MSNRFQLYHNVAITNKVRPISLMQFLSFIVYLQLLLSFVRNSALSKFQFESLLIYCFKKSRTQNIVNMHSCTIYCVALFLIIQHVTYVSMITSLLVALKIRLIRVICVRYFSTLSK